MLKALSVADGAQQVTEAQSLFALSQYTGRACAQMPPASLTAGGSHLKHHRVATQPPGPPGLLSRTAAASAAASVAAAAVASFAACGQQAAAAGPDGCYGGGQYGASGLLTAAA